MSPIRLAAPLLAAALLVGCAKLEEPAGPAPVAITPNQGTGAAALPVLIAGDHFDASAQTDFGAGTGTLAATFTARLLPDAGGAAVALTGVRLTPEKKLTASVPAGIPRGTWALEVTDPAGRTGTLPKAFRVVSAAANLAGFRVVPTESPAHAGVPFLVEVTAVDGAGTIVDGYTGSVTLSDLTGTVSPATAGPFTFGSVAVRVTVTKPLTPDRITATDGARSGTSADFAVEPGPPMALVFRSGPASVAASTCSALVTLELQDSAGNPSPATATVDIALESSPAGALAFHVGGGGCTSPVTGVSMSPGATTATFRYEGSAPGSATIRAVPAGLPSATFAVTLN